MDKGRHRKLDLKIQQEEDIDAEELAAELKQRYSRADYGVFRGDKDVVPQNVLIPSIHDPKLCMVKCKVISSCSSHHLRLEKNEISSLLYSKSF